MTPSRRNTGLFGPAFARGDAAVQVSEEAWLQAILDAEAALAGACAQHGLVPDSASTAIATACDARRYAFEEINGADRISPVAAVVAALRNKVGSPHAEHVHFGASDQDILDTAMMLVTQRALEPLAADLLAVRSALATLASEHRLTPMIGRTSMQQAQPTTFGLKAASWFSAVSDAAYEIVVADESGLLAAQLGGEVGTLAAFGDKGLDVAESYAKRLGLADPYIAWHTARNRPADVASALGIVSGVLSKIALDITLMAQSEIGELREGGAPDRPQSPVAHGVVGSIAVTAIGKRVPSLVATIFAAMAQEHERAAGAWQAECETLSDLLGLVGSQVAWARELMDGLEVDTDRMILNLEEAVLGSGGDLKEIDIGNAPAIIDRLLEDSHPPED